MGALAAIPATMFESFGALGVYAAGVREVNMLTVILAVIIAPIAEEALKPLGVYIIHREERRSLTLKDWAILGLLAGLGFKLLEDALYVFLYFNLEYGADGMVAGALIRVHFPVHLLASLVAGFGIGLWHQTRRIRYFALMLTIAIAIHAVFNLSVSII